MTTAGSVQPQLIPRRSVQFLSIIGNFDAEMVQTNFSRG
jgi:hypothetical protein